ncbi:hypothetical protein EJB05_20030, partial [Eragrostis curvula]
MVKETLVVQEWLQERNEKVAHGSMQDFRINVCRSSIDEPNAAPDARMGKHDSAFELAPREEKLQASLRFHPTDEELVRFYLRRKIQQKSLPIELIRQLDIYKYDPWDLPKLASTGEKEWYFYCPRDRKYRNSTRPNRVTGAGFWKATGTDRPIYSSDGSKCIGLKKSLVFYKGRAAKGVKTDWMMHEFRLPSLTDPSVPQKKPLEKTIPPNDSWAICRIFKKTNSTSQRALSHSWVSPPLSSTNETYIPPTSQAIQRSRHSSENTSSTMTDIVSTIQFTSSSYLSSIVPSSCHNPLSIIDSSSRPAASIVLPTSGAEHQNMSVLSAIPLDLPAGMDIASMVLNATPISLQNMGRIPTNIEFGQPQHCNSNSSSSLVNRCTVDLPDVGSSVNGAPRSINFPFNLQGVLPDDWRMTLPWDSLPCTTEHRAAVPTPQRSMHCDGEAAVLAAREAVPLVHFAERVARTARLSTLGTWANSRAVDRKDRRRQPQRVAEALGEL